MTKSNIFKAPTSYFGNIEYYWNILNSQGVHLDVTETYKKQTERNRTIICGANGKQTLSVPVSKPKGKNSLTSEIQISYQENWIKDHLKSIEAAYRSTPYYEHYIPEIESILNEKDELLIELNEKLVVFILNKLGIDSDVKRVPADYESDVTFEFGQASFNCERYIQSFEDRHGFIPNLSIIDLLFHEGPYSIELIKECSY